MLTGTLTIEARAAQDALPVPGATVQIRDAAGNPLYTLVTGDDGQTETVELAAPPAANSLVPGGSPAYASYDVTIAAPPDYIGVTVRGVQILENEDAILPVTMLPNPTRGEPVQTVYNIPAPAVNQNIERNQEGPRNLRVLDKVVIPYYITVHLGTYNNAAARNVRVPFADYVKNVVSSEIYATWPEESLRANIYAIMTFALNRVYSEWYRSRGYNFDITNSTTTDMAYVENRNIFANISELVDEMLGEYVRRAGRRDPYFTQFCNGTTAKCPGLSQWGTVPLAEQGKDALQILKTYYPADIEIAEADGFAGIPQSYPGYALKPGMSGDDVRTLQNWLNRIRVNYPAIPQINPPDGVYGPQTEAAVKAFQKIFNLTQDGITGKATWNQISWIYTAVTKLGELDSEGDRIGIGNTPPNVVLKQGSRGGDVTQLQYLINALAQYYPMIPTVIQDSNFGADTASAVKAFQTAFGLTPDGVVGPSTWNMLYQAYKSSYGGGNTPVPPTPPPSDWPYPGILRYGDRGSGVTLLQQLVNAAAANDPRIPHLTVDGVYGNATQNAILKAQQLYGLTQDGITGQITWNKLVSIANGGGTPQPAPIPSYPGYLIAQGSQGSYVKLIQESLNKVAKRYPQIPTVTADGAFGPATKNAVTAFQRVFGLTPDGVVGKDTWNAIMNEAANIY